MSQVRLCFGLLVLGLCACSSGPAPLKSAVPADVESAELLASVVTVHRDADDLLSAGLGLEGLRALSAPAIADPAAPTSAELRRRAIYSNWRGIADLASGKGLGPWSEQLPVVPGREWSALEILPGRQQPHRVLAQIPDDFNRTQRCLLVTASSGSRGIYGAIALAGTWGLARGCAVAYTDKGAGTGYFDTASASGVALDGSRSGSAPLEFAPTIADPAGLPAHAVAIKHAHSGENPEADWGLHVLSAARYGLRALDEAFPDQAPFTAGNTRIIAVGLSNAGGAVLRAAERDVDGLFDAVIAVAPNISASDRGRTLYDYSSEAGLYGPCAVAALEHPVSLLPAAARAALAAQRCASLQRAGLLEPGAPAAQARAALAHLHAQGWSDRALRLFEQNLAFDLWRAVVATYAQSYARAGVDQPLCGYSFAMLGPDGKPRASTATERSLWWSDASGIAPGAGVGIVDALADPADSGFHGLFCARALWTGEDVLAQRLRSGVAATRGNARPLSPRLHIIHGLDDALLPIDFSSRPYVEAVRGHGIAIALTEVADAQHFDAFLALPPMAGFQPLLPHAFRALDAALAEL